MQGLFYPGRAVLADFRRRWATYASDFRDGRPPRVEEVALLAGLATPRDVQKTISAAVFLYFSILPTAIALGMLNDQNTRGKISELEEG